MKTKKLNKKKLILSWVIIYLCVLFFSTTIAGCLIFNQNKNLIQIAQNDVQYYIDNQEIAPLAIKNDCNNYFYDSNLNRIFFYAANGEESKFDFDSYAKKYYPEIQENGLHYSVIISKDLHAKIGIIIALPYENNGIFLFLKELNTLKSIIVVLFPSITLLVVICAIFTTILINKNMVFEQMQREYVDNISHELKSPIASIKALTTGIYDGLVTDENKRKNHCAIMLNEVNQLERTVSDMLELSRIQNHQVSCEKEMCTISELFLETLDKRRILCEDLNIEFILTPDAKDFPMLYTNPVLARRMMDILLDNAIKFTPVDGKIYFNMTEDHKSITIAIKDSGPGIRPEEQDLIFKRFYKSDKSHNEKGSGLGLAIAKEIADSLGEKLWLKSTSDKGAEFAFTIHKAH